MEKVIPDIAQRVQASLESIAQSYPENGIMLIVVDSFGNSHYSSNVNQLVAPAVLDSVIKAMQGSKP